MTNVDSDNCNGKGGDKDGNVEIRSPVLDDDPSGGEVIGKDNGVFEEVVPSCGVPEYGQPGAVVKVLVNLPQSRINKPSCISGKALV